jgi:hypothetical protein
MKQSIINKRNQYLIDGATCYLTIVRRDGSEYVATFDALDYDKVKGREPWRISQGKGLIYVEAGVNSKRIFLHNLIANTPEGKVCDVLDGNGLNCRRSNLHNCPYAMLFKTSLKRPPSCKKYPYVWRDGDTDKWVAEYKRRYIGVFPSAWAAHKAVLIFIAQGTLPIRHPNSTGYRYVQQTTTGKFRAQIRKGERVHHIGNFDTPKAAHVAAMKWKARWGKQNATT